MALHNQDICNGIMFMQILSHPHQSTHTHTQEQKKKKDSQAFLKRVVADFIFMRVSAKRRYDICPNCCM